MTLSVSHRREVCRIAIALAACVMTWAGSTPASMVQPAEAAQSRSWESDMRKFEEEDRRSPLPRNEIVFIGSSSIVRWDLEQWFPGLKTINRGFGGSVMADSAEYVERAVLPYKPRIVVLYAGDNDIAGGVTPREVEAQFERFVTKVHGVLPQTKVVVISIKPSLLRWGVVDKMRAANALIKPYCASHGPCDYVDVDPLMLGPDGKPRPELFVQDGLHMTPAGYKIWTAAVLPHLN
jgi:lysophospholipase L1-like esterase